MTSCGNGINRKRRRQNADNSSLAHNDEFRIRILSKWSLHLQWIQNNRCYCCASLNESDYIFPQGIHFFGVRFFLFRFVYTNTFSRYVKSICPDLLWFFFIIIHTGWADRVDTALVLSIRYFPYLHVFWHFRIEHLFLFYDLVVQRSYAAVFNYVYFYVTIVNYYFHHVVVMTYYVCWGGRRGASEML